FPLEVLDRYSAADEPRLNDFPKRVHLELVVGDERERFIGRVEDDVGLGAFEIIALADLFPRLVQRVIHFLKIDCGGDVERRCRGHGYWLRDVLARRPPRLTEWRSRASSIECDSVTSRSFAESVASSP